MALHPSRTVELDLAMDPAFERCRYGIENVLGGVVREESKVRGTIEASFGLIYSDRLTCTLNAVAQSRTRVTIESRRGAQAANSSPSSYVKALADYLTS